MVLWISAKNHLGWMLAIINPMKIMRFYWENVVWSAHISTKLEDTPKCIYLSQHRQSKNGLETQAKPLWFNVQAK